MSEADKMWARKTDEEVRAAAGELGKFTEEGQHALQAEFRRRGLGGESEKTRAQETDEKIWARKTDEEIRAAGRDLGKYAEEGRQVIGAELRRRGFDEPSPTSSKIKPQTSISQRYTDAYRVAKWIVAVGTTVKVVGAVVAAIVGVGLFVLAADRNSAGTGFFAGLLIGGFIWFFSWIAGVFVTAQGQLLRASLDTAVNTSPFLADAEKANLTGAA
jgi:hypothetical protein